jgi:hypothetical protein
MRKLLLAIVVVGLCGISSGCMNSSVYRKWGKQLYEMPLHDGRVEDVSMLLGSEPSRCEPIENPSPLIGIRIGMHQEQPIIVHVTPNSPAYQVGIRAKDIVRSVSGERVATSKQAQSALQNNIREGQAVDIETNRGVVSVIPIIPRVDQCYWEVQAGHVATSNSHAAVNRSGGASSSSGSACEHYFQASCRIIDGFVIGCRASWNE